MMSFVFVAMAAILTFSCEKSEIRTKEEFVHAHEVIPTTIEIPGDSVIVSDTVIIRDTITVIEYVEVPTGKTGWIYGDKAYVNGRNAYLPAFYFKVGELTNQILLKEKITASITANDPIDIFEKIRLLNRDGILDTKENLCTFNYQEEGIQDVISYQMPYSCDKTVTFLHEANENTTINKELDSCVVSTLLFEETKNGYAHVSAIKISENILATATQSFVYANQEPEPDVQNTYEIKHVSLSLKGNQIIDTHQLIWKQNGKTVDSTNYDATFGVTYNKISVAREIATKLVNTSNTTFLVGSEKKLTINVNISDCETATLNGITHCHPNYPVDGATADLECCSLKAKTLTFTKIEGNVLHATAKIGSIDYPVEIAIDDVHGYDVDPYATVTGKNEASLKVYPTINGERTGETITSKGPFEASLTAVTPITQKGDGNVIFVGFNTGNGTATATYSMNGTSFFGEWNWQASTTVNFTMPDGSTVQREVKSEFQVKSTNFYGNNGAYSNTASLYADGIEVATDVQAIVVIPDNGRRIVEEYAKYAAITDVYIGGTRYTVASFISKDMKTGQLYEEVYNTADGSKMFDFAVDTPSIKANEWLSLCWTNETIHAGTLCGVPDVDKVPSKNAWEYRTWDKKANQLMSVQSVTDNTLRGPLRAKATYNNGTLTFKDGSFEMSIQ